MCVGSRDISLCFLFYGRKQRPCEALTAGVATGHPLASASCSGIVITASTITTPSNASVATMAITAMKNNHFSYQMLSKLVMLYQKITSNLLNYD